MEEGLRNPWWWAFAAMCICAAVGLGPVAALAYTALAYVAGPTKVLPALQRIPWDEAPSPPSAKMLGDAGIALCRLPLWVLINLWTTAVPAMGRSLSSLLSPLWQALHARTRGTRSGSGDADGALRGAGGAARTACFGGPGAATREEADRVAAELWRAHTDSEWIRMCFFKL